MIFNPIKRNYSFLSQTRKDRGAVAGCRRRMLLRAYLVFFPLTLIVILTGCATPRVQTADTKLLFSSELLGFIRDGITTREEVVLKLGIPSAQFEGEKILTYQLRADQAGKWHLVAPQINRITGFREWREETCSLVLVFGEDGVLRKHSLVEAK